MLRVATIFLASLLPMTTGSSDHTHPPTATPYLNPDGQYPLHLQVLIASHRYHYRNGFLEYVAQSGVGNFLGEHPSGFAYRTRCEDGFHHTLSGEFYQARWKKPNERIELLMMYANKKKPDTCTIEVTTRPAPYSPADAKGEVDEESS